MKNGNVSSWRKVAKPLTRRRFPSCRSRPEGAVCSKRWAVGQCPSTPAVTPALRRATTAPTLSSKARVRLTWFDYAKTHSVCATCRHFGIARSTYYEWKKRYRPDDLTTLEDRSSRPRRCRGRQWTAAEVEAVRRVREAHSRRGKAKIAVLLARDGVQLSASTVGRILTLLKARRVRVGPPSSLPPTCPEPIQAIDHCGAVRYTACSRGVAQPGSAPALGAGGRRFKSFRPDHLLNHWDAEKAEG